MLRIPSHQKTLCITRPKRARQYSPLDIERSKKGKQTLNQNCVRAKYQYLKLRNSSAKSDFLPIFYWLAMISPMSTATVEKGLPRKAEQSLRTLANSSVLAFRRSPLGYFKIVSRDPEQWSSFHRKTLFTSLHTLYQRGLVDIQEGLDGITTVTITDDGRRIAERLTRIEIPRLAASEWDRKWRIIMFDIPEAKKKSREMLRYHLRRLGFAEFQRSAFIYPFHCSDTITALAEQLALEGHIVTITAESLSNEFQYKKIFGLL